jgi:HSP20 family protein
MNIVKYNPWKRLESPMRRFFGAPFFNGPAWDSEAMSPVVDLLEEEDRLVIQADLPGIPREDVSVDIEDGVLTLKGERRTDNEVKEENYYRRERSWGRFARRFRIPEGVDPDTIAATYKDGVLRIEVPRPEGSRLKKIPIH